MLYARQWLSPELAEDVVQDVFADLLAKRRAPQHPQAWLYAAVRRRAISRARSRARRRRREQRVVEQRRSYFVANPGDPIDARRAQELLESLPSERREAIVLRLWGGLTLAEVGRIAGCSVATAHRRYHAGLEQIREQLEPSPCPNIEETKPE